jgi:hypothetical protein
MLRYGDIEYDILFITTVNKVQSRNKEILSCGCRETLLRVCKIVRYPLCAGCCASPKIGTWTGGNIFIATVGVIQYYYGLPCGGVKNFQKFPHLQYLLILIEPYHFDNFIHHSLVLHQLIGTGRYYFAFRVPGKNRSFPVIDVSVRNFIDKSEIMET